jgi:hypothetical protein
LNIFAVHLSYEKAQICFMVCIRIKVATRSRTKVAGNSHSELPLLPMTGVRYEADIS